MNRSSLSFKYAPIILGVFFCLYISSCKEQKPATTNDWENIPITQQNDRIEVQVIDSKPSDEVDASPPALQEEGTRFIAYNLRNYLSMRRYTDGKSNHQGKPEKEIEALLKVISYGRPDILGLCEIGTQEDLADLQKRLSQRGVQLPHSHFIQGVDTVRSLAILSKYPIRVNAKPQNSAYNIGGRQFHISRGIIDANIKIADKDIRFLGVHLKSKRPTKVADQEMMRRNEAALLRKHIDQILTKEPKSHLLVYGDFNDTKRSQTVYTIKGRAKAKKRLEMIKATDSRGELWTHHWVREDLYSRIDFCLSSLSLTPYIQEDKCLLLDPEYWATASDHRAILIVIR